MKQFTFCLLLALLIALVPNITFAQSVPYGNNPATGKYFQVPDAKLYYEVYGSGAPLLLLHGDTFGYIDEFEEYIPMLSKHFRVVIPAMRGHGKSEIGSKKYSYKLFAEDALAILKKENADVVTVVGFSAGAITALYLTAYYPEKIKNSVILGGMLDISGYRPTALQELKTITGDDCEKMLPHLVQSRKMLMPDSTKYNELIDKLRDTWLQPIWIEKEKAEAIKSPVLIVGGDRDDYIRPEEFLRMYHTIPGSRLAIIPGWGHVGLITNPAMFSDFVMPFLLK